MAKTKFEILGVKELDIKMKRFQNFLGREYNAAMREVGTFGVKTFRRHILEGKAIGNFSASTKLRHAPIILSLQEDYAEEKKKKWGFTHPILIASKKMYNDIQFKTGIAKGAGRSRKINLNWGFKTKRSARIAKAHEQGIKRTKIPTPVVRIPFFFTITEKGHITRILNRRTKIALRKARFNRIRLNRGI